MWILGIAGSHNSGAALIKDGRVVVAVQTERLVRRKRQPLSLDQLSAHAVRVIGYCLRYAGIDVTDLQAIATCTPWEVIHARFADQENAMPDTLLLPPFLTVPHHLAHAEYALHYSPLERCIVLVCDGAGSYEYQQPEFDVREIDDRAIRHIRDRGKESVSAYSFDGRELKLIYRVAYDEDTGAGQRYKDALGRPLHWMSSLGHLWEWSAFYCHGNRHEAGKVMGLAPFGDAGVYSQLNTLSLGDQGEMQIDLQNLFDHFHLPNVAGGDVTGDPHYENIAAHVQQATNECLAELVQYLQGRYPTKTFCYSGGVALNSVTNEYLQRKLGLVLHMNGSCEDNGTAIGAALAAHHSITGLRVAEPVTDCYGREYSDEEVFEALRGYGGRVEKMEWPPLFRLAAEALAAGCVVGWFQGRSEFGPRALGNRSILADPRDPKMQDVLNRKIKHREAFRPYAPAVLEERATEFFDFEGISPVMLRVVPVRVTFLPAVTHIDGTARLQTVNREQNPIFYDLLKEFEIVTSVPVLLNTSFNISGEPIVETPADALRSFLASGMDLLFMGSIVVYPTSAR